MIKKAVYATGDLIGNKTADKDCVTTCYRDSFTAR